MQKVDAEVNVFLEDGSFHVKAILPAPVSSYTEAGDAVYEDGDPDPVRLAQFIVSLKTALTAENLTPGREKRSYGGGGKPARPASDPKPENVPVPEHCGMPMNFKDKFTSNTSGKDVGARWVCAKDKACEKGNNYGGFTVWHDAYMRELNG